jgi:hypothetical protein
MVAGRLHEILFIDDVQRRAYLALASAEDLRQAVDNAEPEVADLLRRLSVEEPVLPAGNRTDPADPVLAQLVAEATRREVAELRARTVANNETLAALSAATTTPTYWEKLLWDPERCREATDRLVAWLLGARQESR